MSPVEIFAHFNYFPNGVIIAVEHPLLSVGSIESHQGVLTQKSPGCHCSSHTEEIPIPEECKVSQVLFITWRQRKMNNNFGTSLTRIGAKG